MTDPAALLARYLRQRRELGEAEIHLDPELLQHLTGAPAKVAPPTVQDASRSVSFAEPVARPGRIAVVAPASPVATLAAGPFAELAAQAAVCTACALASGRTTVVFGDGNPSADLMVVGEAPGGEEDRTGRPFVGKAGKLLDTLLLSIGFPRESVYICNVLKCRPPGNRDPLPEEVHACSPFLRRQIELVAPKAILAVGAFPAQTLLGSQDPNSRLRGSVHRYEGRPLVPPYHPAALLRNPGWIRPVWEDLQRLRRILDD